MKYKDTLGDGWDCACTEYGNSQLNMKLKSF